MSKVLFVSYKNRKISESDILKVKNIEREILPDNVNSNPLIIKTDNNVLSCLYNPVPIVEQIEYSICLGKCYNQDWWEISQDFNILEGSYAIFRQNKNIIELQTDAVASRTIWYYHDTEIFIASNSQLAIIYFLGSFEFNKSVIPWMLSSGTLGPFFSWDSRIKALKPQSKIKLDRELWELTLSEKEIIFDQKKFIKKDEKTIKKELTELIDKSVLSIPFDENVVLPLSGGYDSRGILLSLVKNKKLISLLTWGSKRAVENKRSDAYVAKLLASYFNMNHEYMLTDNPSLDPSIIIDRYLTNSEGRIDHIAGYMDGFDVWEKLFSNGYSAIVRGDEGFGWTPIIAERQARIACGMLFTEDIQNLTHLSMKQDLPLELRKKYNETIEEWRDRLYHSFRLPIILAALNETKSAYVEIINPLLSYSILEYVRQMPDKLRTDKKLFKDIVKNALPSVPFAKESANISSKEQFSREEFKLYFIKSIKSSKLQIIDKSFIESVFENAFKTNKNHKKRSLMEKVKKRMPLFLKVWLRSGFTPLNKLDNGVLLFRIFILYKMNQKIEESIKAINED